MRKQESCLEKEIMQGTMPGLWTRPHCALYSFLWYYYKCFCCCLRWIDSDIAIFVLKVDVKLQLTNYLCWTYCCSRSSFLLILERWHVDIEIRAPSAKSTSVTCQKMPRRKKSRERLGITVDWRASGSQEIHPGLRSSSTKIQKMRRMQCVLSMERAW